MSAHHGSEAMFVPVTDGVTLAVHDLGGGGREGAGTLLICHATGFCGRAYEALAAQLTDEFHVYAVDFRGHGDSTVPANGNFDWRATAADLTIVIEHLAAGPVFAFGHSFGGGALIQAEADHPGLLRAAVLFEPIVLPFEEAPGGESGDGPLAPNFMSVAARRRRPSFPSKAEALLRYASRPPLNELQAGSLAAYVEHGMALAADGTAVLKCTPENEAETFAGSGKPTYEVAGHVTVPVTVAVGPADDQWSPSMFGAGLARALRNGRLERYEFLGHFGPLQDPVTVGRLVLDTFG